VQIQFRQQFRQFFNLLLIAAVFTVLAVNIEAAGLSPKLQAQINGLADNASVGVAIVSFNTSTGLSASHLNILKGLGVTSGVTFNKLGMVGAVLTAGQVRALAANSAVRSVWSNDQLMYYINSARIVTGVDKLRTDSSLTLRNGGCRYQAAVIFRCLLSTPASTPRRPTCHTEPR
jgi:hypothetical protein